MCPPCPTAKGSDAGNPSNGRDPCPPGPSRPGRAPTCDDGNVCTDAPRAPATPGCCVHTDATGFAGINTQLTAVEGAVSGAATADLAPSLAKVVRAKTSAMRAKLGAAQGAAGSPVKREGRMLKAANKALSGRSNAIRNGRKGHKPKISSSLADALLGRLACTATAGQ